MDLVIERKRIFAKEILGPIFYEFCAKLHLHLERNVERKSDNCLVLYMAREGLRLRYLYELYREINSLSPVCAEQDLYISRLSCVKGCIADNFDLVAPIIVKPYVQSNISDLFKGITSQDIALDGKWANIKTSEKSFFEFYCDDSENSQFLREYLIEQGILFKTYIKNIVGNKNNIFLVDSGWTGSTQGLLMKAFSSINWTGLYFGKWSYGKKHPEHFSHIVGLSLDDSIHKGENPRASVFRYHYLIEECLKINFPSVKGYYSTQTVNHVFPDTNIAPESLIQANDNNIHFRGIVDYFQSCHESNITKVSQDAELAYEKLHKLIRFPQKSDLSMMTVQDISADFGKDQSCSVLLHPLKSSPLEKKTRIGKALWKEGQITLEFPTAIACIIQRFVKFPPSV